MHFSNEVSKNLHHQLNNKINTEYRTKKVEDDLSNTAAILREPTIHNKKLILQQQDNESSLGFKQLNTSPLIIDNNKISEKSIRYFFPSSDENNINARLKDNFTLTNSVENTLNADSKHTVDVILEQIKKLSTVQKLLLYLKLPTGKEITNPLKQPTNPLGSRPEISQTIAWIKTHLRPEKETSLPKQDVYNEYQEYCNIHLIKPLSTADFGKVMKQVYPNIRPRRLGTRGNSRYCYAGMANRQPQLPLPVLPQINGNDTYEESPLCKWASSILGANFHTVKQLEQHIIDNNLTSDGACTNECSFIQSCKISKQNDSRKSVDSEKRKLEEDSSSTTQTPPDRNKGKKSRKGSTGSTTKKSPLEDSSNSLEGKKLPPPRVESSPSVVTPTTSSSTSSKLKITDLPPLPPLKRLKANINNNNQTKSGRETNEFLENGNSLEQEEELVKYFQPPSSEEEPKVSQLRMLLERNKAEDKTARRRVSFEVVPESPNSQKKFSFVPISPISNSPFISPKNISSPQRLIRSSSVNSSCNNNKVIVKKEVPLLQNIMHNKFDNVNSGPSEACRSQSVPTAQLPQITPVPSEPIDFDINTDTDSSTLIIMDDSSSSLMIDSTINNDNLNQILNIINEIDVSKLSRSYPNTPTYTHDPIVSGLQQTDACKTIPQTLSIDVQQRDDDPHANLFDDCTGLNLYCEGDALNNLAREVGRLDADVL